MRNLSKFIVAAVLALMALAGTSPVMAQGQNPPSNQSFVAGKYVAKNYNYPGIQIAPGTNIPAGAGTIALYSGSIRLADGRTIVPFSAGGFNTQGQPGSYPAIPVYVGEGTTRELVTPTAVSGCYVGAPQGSCKITATFVNAHGQGETVTSGSQGIQEAINDAAYFGGGVVEVDASENFTFGGPNTVNSSLIAAIVMPNVVVADERSYATQYWVPQGGLTILPAPAVLTALTAVPSATPVGAFGTGTYFMCVAYVDIMGQEGPCSPTFSQAGLATGTFVFTPPVASPGAVGYTIYISLTGGTYQLAYEVPLVTQPTVQGSYPSANGVCVLTTIETVTPACAVTNASYGQIGTVATVSAITVSTSPIDPQVTTVSSTTVYVPNAGGRTTYAYVPGSHIGTPGMVAGTLPFTISAAPATVVPTVLGTLNLAPGIMNVVGRIIEVCGYATTTATASTIENIQFQWDAFGSNVAGKGVLIGNLTGTTTLVTAGHIGFCEDFEATVAGVTVTAGSIQTAGGVGEASGVDLIATNTVLGNTLTGSTALINLAGQARINVIYLHTTATDGAGYTLQDLTAKVIN